MARNQTQTGMPVERNSWVGRATMQATASASTMAARIWPSPPLLELIDPFAMTTPACPMRRKFVEMCEQALKPLPGVQTVEVKLSARESHGHAHGHEAPDTLSEIGAIVAVSSCKGGVGKSTVAAQLACAMRREGLAVGWFDAER